MMMEMTPKNQLLENRLKPIPEMVVMGMDMHYACVLLTGCSGTERTVSVPNRNRCR